MQVSIHNVATVEVEHWHFLPTSARGEFYSLTLCPKNADGEVLGSVTLMSDTLIELSIPQPSIIDREPKA